MYKLYFLIIAVFFVSVSYGQTITFDDQGHTAGQSLSNPYTIVNNGETFQFTLSGGNATSHIYRTTENSCGASGMSHIYAGNFPQTTWTIETTSGNEIDLGTIRFDNVFQCFSFEYNLTVEGFKNNTSTGTQTFTTNGVNSIFTSNTNFNDVDKIVITSADLGQLGIDDINWTAATLNNSVFDYEKIVKLYHDNLSKKIVLDIQNNDLSFTNIAIYNTSGKQILQSSAKQISTDNLKNGIYIAIVNFESFSVNKKIIIR